MNLKDFPYLYPIDETLRCFEGFIEVQGINVGICLTLNDVKSTLDAKLTGNSLFDRLTLPYRAEIDALLKLDLQLEEFLKKLIQLLNESMISKVVPVECLINNRLVKVLSEINEIGWDHVVDLDLNNSRLRLRSVDERNRCHEIYFEIPFDYPNTSVKASSLVDLSTVSDDLTTIIEHFENFVDKINFHQNFWLEVDHLDDYILLINSSQSEYYSYKRIFVVEKSVIAEITINPECPRAMPECNLNGSPDLVRNVQKSFLENLEDWDEENKLLDNLLYVFGSRLPSKNVDFKDMKVNCGICLLVECKDEKDTFCTNTNCGQLYHTKCLITWLLTSNVYKKQIGTKIFGNCVYCSSQLAVFLDDHSKLFLDSK